MKTIIGFFVTPALVSLAISLWANAVLEARRARRDHITKLFEGARDDVRRGVEAGVECFSTKPADRTHLQEARVLSADREIRAAVSLLLGRVRSPGCDEATHKAREAFQSLVVELTGGNFQARRGVISREHITRLVHAGANMRTALARLRDAELKDGFDQDPILSWMVGKYEWAQKNWPFRSVP